MDIAPIDSWLPRTRGRPLAIAGPCSAESEAQVLATARALSAIGGVRVFRAGVWKPRTKPNTFEGRGPEALPWLQAVKEETGMLTTVEVATAAHAELALRYEVDILWIGARTSANPFAVQEIADALVGADIPVLVKNPVNAELALWEGALERIAGAGIARLGAIHRGFSCYEKTAYRNQPLWTIPIELKRRLPELPMICDPSHITGDRSLIEKVAQKAMDLDFDGLMIETHVNPGEALSDAAQQITPQRLGEILNALSVRSEYSADKSFAAELEAQRGKIERIDNELIESLKERMKIVTEIGRAKIENNVTALQIHHLDQLMNKRMRLAESLGLSPEYVREVFSVIHGESVKVQSDMMELASAARAEDETG